MQGDLFRMQQILNRDRLLDAKKLPDIITNEVADRLSSFLEIDRCSTKLRVNQGGDMEILISIKAKSWVR